MPIDHPAPLPPVELATRVGPGASADPYEAYLQEGASVRGRIEAALPADWVWDAKTVLDFGCGSARVLRHFLPEAERAEFWGCDIDARSIAWIRDHLAPPLHVVENDVLPPLTFATGTFDLVWATSVFTHIDAWSAWLIEVHRVLAPGGLLVASFLGEGVWEGLLGEPYDEDRVGMTVRGHWVDGGPGAWVFHSEWWLREHWGRLFEVLDVQRPPRDDDGAPQVTHSYITLRALPGSRTAAELEAVDPAEPRELDGLRTQVRILRAEIDDLLQAPQQAELQRTMGVRELVKRSRLGPAALRVRDRLRRAPA